MIYGVIQHVIGNPKQFYNQTAKEIQNEADKFISLS